MLSKIQTIILEERPVDANALQINPKFVELKIKDLLTIGSLIWTQETFTLNMESVADFSPAFTITLSSDKGITTEEIIRFK